MPEAVLASVVFLIGLDLVDIEGMKRIYQQRRSEFWVALITMITVVLIGVEQGIILAMVLSLIEHTRHGYKPKNSLLVPLQDSSVLHTEPVSSGVQALPGLIIYRFTHSLYYANVQQFSDELLALSENADPPLKWLCLDASAIDDVDFSAAETLRSLFITLHERGIRLVIAQVNDYMCQNSKYELRKLYGDDAFFDSLDDVIHAYQKLN